MLFLIGSALIYKMKLTKEEAEFVISRQAQIERTADIKYQCHIMGLSEDEFWNEFVWIPLMRKRFEEKITSGE